MKKLIPCLLTMSLVLSPISTAMAEETSESAASADVTTQTDSLASDTTADTSTPADSLTSDAAAALPSPGQVINGFEVKELRDFPDIRGTVVFFEHQKTGAELMYIANDDQNRTFNLTFATRAIDNTGLPHVFEHATTDGSKKYPSRSLFMNLMKQTYVTYMNAYTFENQTTYPFSSLSEEQLLRTADFYVDSCLHPMIMEDEEIFREEAWRYRMENPDADLTIEGTVYSEELGRLDMEEMAEYNTRRTAFPGSMYGNMYGGDTDFIPEMTWESLKSYHERYYHPSNSLALLYGDFEDYAAFLKLLDEAYASYEKKEFTFEDSDYTPITGPVSAEFSYPIEEGSSTENQAILKYKILLPGLTEEDPEYDKICNLSNLLADSAYLRQKVARTLSFGKFAVGIDTDGPECTLDFEVTLANEKEAALFKQAIDQGLAEMAEIGFSKDEAEVCEAQQRRTIKQLKDTRDLGVELTNVMAREYHSSGNPFEYVEEFEVVQNMAAWNQEDAYRPLIKKWLVDNNLNALTATYPAAGEKEKKDAALAARLQEIKSGMTEEEKQAIVEATQSQAETDDSSEYVRQLQAVTIDTLPEDFTIPEIRDVTDERGVRHIDGVADMNGISTNYLYFDAQGLDKEELLWAQLYCDMLKYLPTRRHTLPELKQLIRRYIPENGGKMVAYGYGEKAVPVLNYVWIVLDEDLPKAYELTEEILYETEFTDTELLLAEFQSLRQYLAGDRNTIDSNRMLYRGFSEKENRIGYLSYWGGFDYYQFVKKMEQQLLEDPEMVVSKLEEIQEYFHNRTNAIVCFCGSEESIKKNREAVDAFMDDLEEKPIEPQTYELPVPLRREAVVVDSNVQINAIYAAWETLGVEEYDASWQIIGSYVTDAYLVPQLRVQYGVYNAWNTAGEDSGLTLTSYYDPNIKETYQVLESLPQQLAEAEVDQETLNAYILSYYTEATMAQYGLLTRAILYCNLVLNGVDPEVRRTYLKQLKTVTPQKIRDAAPIYQKLVDYGVRETMGSASKIKENEELFDTVLSPFQD